MRPLGSHITTLPLLRNTCIALQRDTMFFEENPGRHFLSMETSMKTIGTRNAKHSLAAMATMGRYQFESSAETQKDTSHR
ncbi:hypothetical protein N9933_00640 [bacterium]|nr:hypothetical protein [bacterium]